MTAATSQSGARRVPLAALVLEFDRVMADWGITWPPPPCHCTGGKPCPHPDMDDARRVLASRT